MPSSSLRHWDSWKIYFMRWWNMVCHQYVNWFLKVKHWQHVNSMWVNDCFQGCIEGICHGLPDQHKKDWAVWLKYSIWCWFEILWVCVLQDMKQEHVHIWMSLVNRWFKILGSAVEFRYLFSFTSNFDTYRYASFVK